MKEFQKSFEDSLTKKLKSKGWLTMSDISTLSSTEHLCWICRSLGIGSPCKHPGDKKECKCAQCFKGKRSKKINKAIKVWEREHSGESFQL